MRQLYSCKGFDSHGIFSSHMISIGCALTFSTELEGARDK